MDSFHRKGKGECLTEDERRRASHHPSQSNNGAAKDLLARFHVLWYSQLIASALTFVNPMVLDMLINFMDPNSTDPEWRGYFYALLMFVSPMFESLFNSQYEYRINLISMKIRACVISVIYRKVTSTLSTFLLFLL